MWPHLVLASLFAAGGQSFAPGTIRWTDAHSNSLVLAPKACISDVMATMIPQNLVMVDSQKFEKTSPDQMPSFKRHRDHTITWHTGLCLEAVGCVVRINRCSGALNQTWDWIPVGHRRHSIRLKGSNRCLQVSQTGYSTEALVELRECKEGATRSWTFDDAFAPPTESTPSRLALSSFLRHGMLCLLAIAALGSLSLGVLLWKFQAKARNVTLDRDLFFMAMDEKAGLCLRTCLALRLDTRVRRVAPVAMEESPTGACDGSGRDNEGNEHVNESSHPSIGLQLTRRKTLTGSVAAVVLGFAADAGKTLEGAIEAGQMSRASIMLRVSQIAEFDELVLRRLANLTETERAKEGIFVSWPQMAMSLESLFETTELDRLPTCAKPAERLKEIQRFAESGTGKLSPVELSSIADWYALARNELDETYKTWRAFVQAEMEGIARGEGFLISEEEQLLQSELLQGVFPTIHKSSLDSLHAAFGHNVSDTVYIINDLSVPLEPPCVPRGATEGGRSISKADKLLDAQAACWQDDEWLRLLCCDAYRSFAAWDEVFHHGQHVIVRMQVVCQGQLNGFGIALLGSAQSANTLTQINFDEPNVADSFAVGFDCSNPPPVPNEVFPKDYLLNESGNIYNRPQCEVSLHTNGTERSNRVAPVDFHRIQCPFEVQLELQFVPLGALVSVCIHRRQVYVDHFIAMLSPYSFRLVVGGRALPVQVCGPTAPMAPCKLHVGHISTLVESGFTMPVPKSLRVFSREPVDGAHREVQTQLEGTPHSAAIGSAVLEYRLELPMPKHDGWDRKASVNLRFSDSEGNGDCEIARLITPYGREWTWYFDVSDYLPLLCKQSVNCVSFIDSWETPGFLVTMKLHFSDVAPVANAMPSLRPLDVEQLWLFSSEYGDASGALRQLLAPRDLRPPQGAIAARIHMVVTGHGFGNTSCNGAEFMPISTTLKLSGKPIGRKVWWRDDAYLNPCRPQGGSWKHDRAGWIPGDKVDPWILELPGNGAGVLECEFGPYTNKGQESANVWLSCNVIWLGPKEAVEQTIKHQDPSGDSCTLIHSSQTPFVLRTMRVGATLWTNREFKVSAIPDELLDTVFFAGPCKELPSGNFTLTIPGPASVYLYSEAGARSGNVSTLGWENLHKILSYPASVDGAQTASCEIWFKYFEKPASIDIPMVAPLVGGVAVRLDLPSA